MKRNYTIVALVILLAASLGVNAWLHREVRRYEGRQPFLPFFISLRRFEFNIPSLGYPTATSEIF